MKVLHVAETAQGGVGSYLDELVPLQMRRYGSDNIRAVLPADHAAHFPALSRWGDPGFRAGAGPRLAAACRMASVALGLLRRWRPDVVHLHSTFAGLLMRPLLAALPDRPAVVYCAHGWAFDRRTARWQATSAARCERLLCRLADVVLCVSRHELRQALHAGLDRRRLDVVLSGISDIECAGGQSAESSRWPADALRVLFVGRLDEQKGADVLCAAMDRLGSRAFALVAGSGVAGTARVEAAANVELLGWRSRAEIATLYAGADLLVMPSRWEALGLAAIEAMRAGLPVVASRVGGLPEVVQDGVTGRLVPPGDAAALAAVLQGLDRASLREMGRRGRQRYLDCFQAAPWADGIDRAYRSACHTRAVGRAVSQARAGNAR